jgi:hypothetical protein
LTTTTDDQAEYRRMIQNLTRLTDWLMAHGVGNDVAIRATVAELAGDVLELKEWKASEENHRG